MTKTNKIQEKIVFNHYYRLRHDLKRSYILSKENEIANVSVENTWISKIHPIYAMIFSFLSEPISTNKLYDELSYFLDIEKQKVEEIIVSLINNDKTIINKYGSTVSIFPKNIIIKESELNSKVLYFDITEDVKFEVYTEVTVKVTVFGDNTQCVQVMLGLCSLKIQEVNYLQNYTASIVWG